MKINMNEWNTVMINIVNNSLYHKVFISKKHIIGTFTPRQLSTLQKAQYF